LKTSDDEGPEIPITAGHGKAQVKQNMKFDQISNAKLLKNNMR